MEKFVISITESLKRSIVVEAKTSYEAIERVQNLYHNGRIVLVDEDSTPYTEFTDETDEHDDFSGLPSADEY